MTIISEKRSTYAGLTGVVTTTVSLVSREEFIKTSSYRLAGERAMSFGQLMRTGSQGEHINNPYTDEIENFSYDRLAEVFQGMDFDNSYISIEFKFIPDAGNKRVYPSGMVNELRRLGFSEAQIQNMIEQERKARKSDRRPRNNADNQQE